MRRGILVIDNDKKELELYKNILMSIPGDFHCRYAADATKALDLLRNYLPGIIFINNDLPVINGIQFLSVVKSEERLKSIRIFLYANYIGDEVCKMAKTLGASGCIEKPANADTFARELRAIIDPVLLPEYVFFSRQYQNTALGSNGSNVYHGPASSFGAPD